MLLQIAPPAWRPRLLDNLRPLLRPLAISLAVHALVFWQAPGLLLSPASPLAAGDQLRASLQKTPAPAPHPEQPLVSPPEPAETAPTRQPEERQYAPTAPPSEPAAEPVQEQAGPDALPATPLEPQRSGIDLAGLRLYHIALGQKARQFRRYPQAARDAGWQGRVTLRLAVSEAGAPLNLKLLGSSDYPVLDQAALEMMLLAAGHTEVPESLRGRAFTIDLAVDFNPADAP